jgi:hypothetical protein
MLSAMLCHSVETMKFDAVCGVVRPMRGILMYLTAATRNGGYETSNGCSSNPSKFTFNPHSRTYMSCFFPYPFSLWWHTNFQINILLPLHAHLNVICTNTKVGIQVSVLFTNRKRWEICKRGMSVSGEALALSNGLFEFFYKTRNIALITHFITKNLILYEAFQPLRFAMIRK